ncbi:MAG: MarR family transcriptional regulator [Pseudonocardia sp.]
MVSLPVPADAAPEPESVVEILDRADRAVDAVLTPVTSREGLSREAWRVLLLLSRSGGRSMGEIAEHAAIPNPTATRVIDRLVAHSLAYRRSDPGDRRRVLVHLASGGRQVVQRVSQELEERVDLAVGGQQAVSDSQVGALLTQLTDTLQQVAD